MLDKISIFWHECAKYTKHKHEQKRKKLDCHTKFIFSIQLFSLSFYTTGYLWADTTSNVSCWVGEFQLFPHSSLLLFLLPERVWWRLFNPVCVDPSLIPRVVPWPSTFLVSGSTCINFISLIIFLWIEDVRHQLLQTNQVVQVLPKKRGRVQKKPITDLNLQEEWIIGGYYTL